MGGILTSCYTYKDVYEIIFHVIDKSFMLINLESFLHVCVALLMPTKGLIVAASKQAQASKQARWWGSRICFNAAKASFNRLPLG